MEFTGQKRHCTKAGAGSLLLTFSSPTERREQQEVQEGYEGSKPSPRDRLHLPKLQSAPPTGGSNVQIHEPVGVTSHSDCLRGRG